MKTRAKLLCLLGFLLAPMPLSAQEAAVGATPLEIHMFHWLQGSREWRTNNPSYDPAAEPMTGSWFKEFAVRWDYGPHKQHLVGGIYAIAADGTEVNASTMYAFYDPVENKVEQVQIGRRGSYSIDRTEPRLTPTPYGEPEIGVAVEHLADGSTARRKHENTFFEDGRQLTDVYIQNDAGEWEFFRNWVWRLMPQQRGDN